MTLTENEFQIDEFPKALMVTLCPNLGELDIQRCSSSIEALFSQVKSNPGKDLIINLGNTHYLGSSALSMFIRLWKTISSHQATLLFCEVSPELQEVFKAAKFDELWPMYATKEEALAVSN